MNFFRSGIKNALHHLMIMTDMAHVTLPTFAIDLSPDSNRERLATEVSGKIDDFLDTRCGDKLNDDDAAMVGDIVDDAVQMMVDWLSQRETTSKATMALTIPLNKDELAPDVHVTIEVTVRNSEDDYVALVDSDDSCSNTSFDSCESQE
jgi:hypothetical protein